jgi:hypothetical protein
VRYPGYKRYIGKSVDEVRAIVAKELERTKKSPLYRYMHEKILRK